MTARAASQTENVSLGDNRVENIHNEGSLPMAIPIPMRPAVDMPLLQ